MYVRPEHCKSLRPAILFKHHNAISPVVIFVIIVFVIIVIGAFVIIFVIIVFVIIFVIIVFVIIVIGAFVIIFVIIVFVIIFVSFVIIFAFFDVIICGIVIRQPSRPRLQGSLQVHSKSGPQLHQHALHKRLSPCSCPPN